MNLTKILEEASRLRIAVVGDYILDRYLIGEVNRISPEAPVPVLDLKRTSENPGGAGNVTANLRELGVQVSEFYGKHKPVKTRVMAGNHHVIRIDEEQEPYWMHWDEVDIGLGYGIENKKFNAVVISDYGKGMVSRDVVKELIVLCNLNDIPVVVDSKQSLDIFAGATVVKCNEKEWQNQLLFPDEPHQWILDNKFQALVVTRGHLGMTLDDCVGNHLITRTHSIDVCDPCGAGDTVTAMLALGLTLKNEFDGFFEAVELANLAASEVCRHPGVQPINKELLIKRFNEVYGK